MPPPIGKNRKIRYRLDLPMQSVCARVKAAAIFTLSALHVTYERDGWVFFKQWPILCEFKSKKDNKCVG